MWALHLIHVHPTSGASPARIVPESPSDEPELQWYMPLLLQWWICGLQNPVDLVHYSLQLPSYFEGWKDSWLNCRVLKWTGLCSKARKLIGLIYRCFYQHSSPAWESLSDVFNTCASQVWHTSKISEIDSLEKVQNFTLRVCCSKQWNSSCDELLSLPILQPCILYLDTYPPC